MDETLDLRELALALYRRKGIIVLMIVVSVAAAFIASLRMPNVYEANTKVLVKDPSSSPERLVLEGIQGIGRNPVQNYVEILRSRSVALQAAEKLGFQWDVYDPEFAAFRNSISIQPASGAETIVISIQNEDPELASDIANAMAETFIERSKEINRTEANSARIFIEDQLKIVEEQLEEVETALQRFREDERILDPNEETRILLGRITDLETEYTMTMLTYDETAAKLDKVRERLELEEETYISSTTISNNPMVNTHRSTLSKLETELAGLRNQYSEEHPQVVSLKAQIAEVETQLSKEVERVVSNETRSVNPVYQNLVADLALLETDSMLYASRLDALRAQIEIAEEWLNDLPQKELSLAKLMRDQNVTEQIYLLLRNRYEEIRIAEAMQTADVMVVDPSIVPHKPIKPRKMLNVAIAAFLGLFVGVGLAFVLEFLDTSLKTAEEVEEYLELPIMGRIPQQDIKS